MIPPYKGFRYNSSLPWFSNLSSLPWLLMYSRIIASFLPTVLAQYPLLQKWLPQYLFLSSANLLNVLIAVFHFEVPITSDTAYFGGMAEQICTWSLPTWPSKISILIHVQSFLISSLTAFRTSPPNTLYRYFDTITSDICSPIPHVLI